MKFHMLMLMNEWMMLVLMKCKCQMQCLTLGCYRKPIKHVFVFTLSVGLKHFWVDLDGWHVFAPTP